MTVLHGWGAVAPATSVMSAHCLAGSTDARQDQVGSPYMICVPICVARAHVDCSGLAVDSFCGDDLWPETDLPRRRVDGGGMEDTVPDLLSGVEGDTHVDYRRRRSVPL